MAATPDNPLVFHLPPSHAHDTLIHSGEPRGSLEYLFLELYGLLYWSSIHRTGADVQCRRTGVDSSWGRAGHHYCRGAPSDGTCANSHCHHFPRAKRVRGLEWTTSRYIPGYVPFLQPLSDSKMTVEWVSGNLRPEVKYITTWPGTGFSE
jgi:hypothetical protein